MMNCNDYFNHCVLLNPTLICPTPYFAREFLSIYKLFLKCLFYIDYIHSNKKIKQLQIGYQKIRICEDLMETRQGLLEPINISEE